MASCDRSLNLSWDFQSSRGPNLVRVTTPIRDLSPRSFQVIDRAHPERHGRDSEIEAPSKHVVQLPSAEIVGYSGVSEVVLAGIASVAIKDDPDMAWDRM